MLWHLGRARFCASATRTCLVLVRTGGVALPSSEGGGGGGACSTGASVAGAVTGVSWTTGSVGAVGHKQARSTTQGLLIDSDDSCDIWH